MSFLGSVGSTIGGLWDDITGKSQMKMMRDAIEYQKQKDAQTRGDLAPYRAFGSDQLNKLAEFMQSRNAGDYIDPGYAFRKSQGDQSIANSASSTGMAQSGDTLRALEQYGQDYGSSEYNNAFNRYLNEGNFRENLAGMGENAALGGGQLANQGAANVGNITADTDWGAPGKVIGNLIGGAVGYGANALAKRFAMPGGSNIFKTSSPVPAPRVGNDFDTVG